MTATQLITAIEQRYKLDGAFSRILTYGGLAKCGHRDGWSWKLDLHDLAKHNVIEHDGSLVHDDAAPGQTFAPTGVDRVLVRQLLGASSRADALTLQDLCHAQVLRQASSGPISSVLKSISKGEVALLYKTFGVKQGRESGEGEVLVPKSHVEQWLGQERLPADWTGPEQGIGFLSTFRLVQKIGGMETNVNEKETG